MTAIVYSVIGTGPAPVVPAYATDQRSLILTIVHGGSTWDWIDGTTGVFQDVGLGDGTPTTVNVPTIGGAPIVDENGRQWYWTSAGVLTTLPPLGGGTGKIQSTAIAAVAQVVPASQVIRGGGSSDRAAELGALLGEPPKPPAPANLVVTQPESSMMVNTSVDQAISQPSDIAAKPPKPVIGTPETTPVQLVSAASTATDVPRPAGDVGAGLNAGAQPVVEQPAASSASASSAPTLGASISKGTWIAVAVVGVVAIVGAWFLWGRR
jgi:hypothetical protein